MWYVGDGWVIRPAPTICLSSQWDTLIQLLRRYIDDVFGIWSGTIRQFDLFVKNLNEVTTPLGIQFGDCQIGKSVNYLDVKLSLTENNVIEFQLHKKDTDA